MNVCLSGLFVCRQDYANTISWNLMKKNQMCLGATYIPINM